MTKLNTTMEIVSYVVKNGYHRQCNEDGSINFGYIEHDLVVDSLDGKVDFDHDRVDVAFEFMACCDVFVSPVAATLTFAGAV